MFFLGIKRSFSLLVFLILFGSFSILMLSYLSTWYSSLTSQLKNEGLIRRDLVQGKLSNLLNHLSHSTNEFYSRKLAKIEKYRTMFKLTNPGHMGEPVILPEKLPDDVKELVEDGWKQYTINEFVSDLIPLRRPLPDIRDDYCRQQSYKNLPKASVIIIFHNEAWSMVLRTMHSVLDRSPDELLEEIIFVDDCSDREHLQEPFEDYIAQYPKVKLMRSPKRNGVMLSRMWGAANAKGPALVFIDCHMEVMPGYLEPLLDRIAKNRNSSAIPTIDGLDRHTLRYDYHLDPKHYPRHGFAWNMDHIWIGVPDYVRNKQSHPSEPFYSVTMLGAMFSIHKDYFEELGMYDPNFDVYGAEDVELSFKVWLCGGVLEQVPCSHAGHMFREKFFYNFPKGRGGYRWNTDRLAEVWLDSYKKYYYLAVGDDKRDYGDISEQIELRKRLNCKPFDWLVKNIYPEVTFLSKKANETKS